MAVDKIEKMSEDKLVQILNQLRLDSSEYISTGLQENWKEAQKYYFGEKLGNEVEGKSQVISRDVSDAIDWMMPSLMDIFCGGKKAVMFEPQTQEDVELAEQATNYANYVFYRKNRGFEIMHNWFKDALMFKRGIVKHYWETVEDVVTEIYSNLDETDLQLLLMDEDVEIIERTPLEEGMHDVKITKVVRKEQIRIENVPPEEFFIDRWAKHTDEATYVAHERKVSISYLRQIGVSEDVIAELKRNGESTYVSDELRIVREKFNGNYTTDFTQQEGGEANDKVVLTEAYVRVDYDGDGITELRRIVSVGDTILSNEDWDCVPFSTLTPNPIQHIFYGQSVFDMVKDVQDIKTALLRNQLDNMYLTNMGRYVVVEGQVNLQDLQNNKAGGVIREKMQGALRPMDQPMLPQGAYDMLGYMDTLKTNRTGVSARTQGLDDKVLNSHTGQGQVNKVMSVAEQRLKLIARIFAETGVRDLFLSIYRLAMKYQNKEEQFRLNGKFVRVNPTKWKDRTDMEIIVGLGTNDKDQQLIHLSKMFELQQNIIKSGGMGILTNQEKVYNLLKELSDNAGYKDAEKFWLDPTTPEAMQAIQEQLEAAKRPTPEQIKAESEAKAKQVEVQLKQVEAQTEQKRGETEQQIKLMELQLRERELALQEREQALQEDIQDMERQKFEWSKQLNISEIILEREGQKAVSIGDNKLFKGRNKGKTDSGNTGESRSPRNDS